MADHQHKEKEEEKKIKEKIQQNPDEVDDTKEKPVTPEPPQRKHPQAEPESDEPDKKS